MLSIFSGVPSVKEPHPHVSWPPKDPDTTLRLIEEYIKGESSYTGREGPILDLENAFARYHNRKYAIAVSSGTAALYSAFFSLKLKPGDEVLAPVYTYHATVTPLLHLGVKPVFCDADPVTGNIKAEEILRRATANTKAIIITHMWGYPCDMKEILYCSKQLGIPIIEDCSHAHGSTYRNQLVGTFGNIACWSLQGAKIIPAGEGGIMLTDDRDIYEHATLLGHWGKRSETEVVQGDLRELARTGYGLKLRIHPLGAVLALIAMNKFDSWIKNRSILLNQLVDGLASIPGIIPPFTSDYATRGCWYGFVCRVEDKALKKVTFSNFIKALQAEGVEAKITNVLPLNQMPLFRNIKNIEILNFSSEINFDISYPGAEEFTHSAFQLPTFTDLQSKPLIQEYIDAIRRVVTNIQDLYLLK